MATKPGLPLTKRKVFVIIVNFLEASINFYQNKIILITLLSTYLIFIYYFKMATVVNGYFIPKDKTSEYLILVVVLFLIIGSWAIILYFTTRYNTSNIKAFETCAIGLCPTNRATGEKRCPVNTAIPLEYDPILEGCNPPKACTDNATPYAVQSDGSTDFNGICDVEGCRCVNYFSTPSYTQVLFNVGGGDIYNQPPNQQSRIVFSQQATPYAGEGNIVPIRYKDPTVQFPSISPSYLPNIMPNNCSVLFSEIPEPNPTDLLSCINRNPCVVGRMAFVPPNVVAYNNIIADSNNLLSGGTPLACVPNTVENAPEPLSYPNSCFTDTIQLYVPVFNSTTGRINCVPYSA